MGTVVVVAVLLIALAWFFWPDKTPPRRTGNPELEQAERDVQEASDQESVRDWGPGTGQKPLP
jgi:hypothetical protein